ncbi:hypothetical protein EON67_06800 [archaeon]|nr:MAG: hypothetical protein EON67_06800 [archaeon]
MEAFSVLKWAPPAIPAAMSADAVRAFAQALGLSPRYTQVPLVIGTPQLGCKRGRVLRVRSVCAVTLARRTAAAPTPADYLVSELQAARLALCQAHNDITLAKPVVSTHEETVRICKALAVPVTEEAAKAHPDRVLRQIKGKVCDSTC